MHYLLVLSDENGKVEHGNNLITSLVKILLVYDWIKDAQDCNYCYRKEIEHEIVLKLHSWRVNKVE